MDIKFYDFNFNLLAILPQYSYTIGYSSLNYSVDFCGNGSFEIDYLSDKIDGIVKANKNGLFIVLDDFQGYLTGYVINEQKSKILGKHLNGLLHRRIIPPFSQTTASNVETMARTVISANYDFLQLGTAKGGFSSTITHETTDYQSGDEFIKTLLTKDNAGYRISADFVSKQLTFDVLKRKENSLMLSASNLNAYDFETSYDNKDLAFVGYYSETQPNDENGNAVDDIVKTVTTDSTKTGINKICVWLSAKTQSEALAELKTKKALFDITASTRRVVWRTDYNLGDIVRVQCGGETIKKVITSVNVAFENSRAETPKLTEYEVTD